MCCLMITQGFVEEVQSSPASAKPALTLLATLYGLTRVERRLAFYLAAGMLLPQAMRSKISMVMLKASCIPPQGALLTDIAIRQHPLPMAAAVGI